MGGHWKKCRWAGEGLRYVWTAEEAIVRVAGESIVRGAGESIVVASGEGVVREMKSEEAKERLVLQQI